MNQKQILFNLIRQKICGAEVSAKLQQNIDPDTLQALYTVSKKFDIAPLVGMSLSENNAFSSNEASALFRRELMLSVMRYEKMNYQFEAIVKVLEEEKIAYLPLKGAVIRDLYPEKWMRTSCDIDILVKEDDIPGAIEALCNKLSYRADSKKKSHDISLFSEDGTHLELHFSIKEKMANIDKLLSRVWQYAFPKAEGSFRYAMTNEFMIFHNLSHMAYHFLCGGCGIRPFIDLYLLEKTLDYDRETLSQFCKECSIETFRISVEKLIRVWLEGEEHDTLTEELESYILNGGLYGDETRSILIERQKSGGKVSYMVKRIFPPYGELSQRYPKLEKRRWLFPFYQIKRWFDILAEGKAKHAVKELAVAANADQEKSERLMQLLLRVGLDP